MYNYDFRHHFWGAKSQLSFYGENHDVNVGLSCNKFKRRHIGSERSAGILYSNTGFKDDFSAFLKLNYYFGRLKLYGDLQIRRTTFLYEGDVELPVLTWEFVNPRAGVSYSLNKSNVLYYSFGSNGREPTRNDIFFGEDNLGTRVDGEPNYSTVDPEFVYNHELGFRGTFDFGRVSCNLFLMSFENEITLNGQYGPNGLPLRSKVATSIRSGAECEVAIDVTEAVLYSANGQYLYSKIEDGDNEIEHVLSPHLIINQQISYSADNVRFAAFYKFQSASFLDYQNTFELPAQHYVELTGSYAVNDVLIKVIMRNVLDTQNLSHGYIGLAEEPLYFVEAPLSFTLGVAWKPF